MRLISSLFAILACALATMPLQAAAQTITPAPAPGGSNGQIQYNNAGSLGGLVTTGTGNAVLATSPALVTPALGIPSSVTLTNAVGLPISSGVSGLGAGVGAILGTAASGTGSICATVSCALTTPSLGVATATSMAIGGAAIGSFGLAVQADANFNSNNVYFYLPPKIGWGFVSGCPAQGSVNYEGLNVCGNTSDNMLWLQQENQSAYSAVAYAQYNGTWAAASGYGNPSSLAIFANDFYQELNGVPWSVIAGDSCGRDLDVNGTTGNIGVFACSGANTTAYGSQNFSIYRASGDVWTKGWLLVDGGNSTNTAPTTTSIFDAIGPVLVGGDATGARVSAVLGALNVDDPGTINISMTKSSVVTAQWGLDGSSGSDTARALQLIDHDNSDAPVATWAMNGTRLTRFATLGDQNYAYSQPTTGSAVTIADTSDLVIIDPSGTLSILTVNLPTCSSLYDGKFASFSSSHIITTLTVGATAGSVVGADSTLAVGGGDKFMCRGANTTWYRVP